MADDKPLTIERAQELLAEHTREGDPVAVEFYQREIIRLTNPKAYADIRAKRQAEQDRVARELADDPSNGWIGAWRDMHRR